MTDYNLQRIRHLSNIKLKAAGDYVLYWMQIYRRFEFNFALEYAVELANKLNKPLLVYEGLAIDYPWASDRFHSFLMEGKYENKQIANTLKINYLSYIEPIQGHGRGLVEELISKSCAVVTDDFPVFIIQKHNRSLASKVNKPYIVVDSNGLIPFNKSDKAPYSAYLFRKVVQRCFVEAITNMPLRNPLDSLKNRATIDLSFLNSKWLNTILNGYDIYKHLQSLPINHAVHPLANYKGTRKAALEQFDIFCKSKLFAYEDKRNHPDENAISKMSGYLHFGKISEHEMVSNVLRYQPPEWDLSQITYNNGSRGAFFNGDPSISAFLDELVTWRGVGHHFAHFNRGYDQFESLPDWAISTLKKHESDPREFVYSLDRFESALTHDEIWNAAQQQLVQDGFIHNYLRMLWGKKILEWTNKAEEALDIMIELNNKYAIDGRDPNSYSGIFWILGRFDRPWQERSILGQIRYMSSDSTRKKIKLTHYLKTYAQSVLPFND